MPKRLTSVLVSICLIVSLIPANVAYGLPDREIWDEVWYNCPCGPCEPTLEGQWLLTCDGQMNGWGALPYSDPCHRTVETPGSWCLE